MNLTHLCGLGHGGALGAYEWNAVLIPQISAPPSHRDLSLSWRKRGGTLRAVLCIRSLLSVMLGWRVLAVLITHLHRLHTTPRFWLVQSAPDDVSWQNYST